MHDKRRADGPSQVSGDRKPPPVRQCPRCGEREVTPLGDCDSTALWFACPTCRRVWAEHPPTPTKDS